MEYKTAIITISPENKDRQMDVQTNGVSNLDILEHLNALTKLFAQRIIIEAKEIGCSDHEEFEGYIEFLRKNKL